MQGPIHPPAEEAVQALPQVVDVLPRLQVLLQVRQHHVGQAEAAEAAIGHLIQPRGAQEHLQRQHQRRQRRVGGHLLPHKVGGARAAAIAEGDVHVDAAARAGLDDGDAGAGDDGQRADAQLFEPGGSSKAAEAGSRMSFAGHPTT